MTKKKQPDAGKQDDAGQLKKRLEETEATLDAIRQYMVDAFVVTRENGIQVVTLTDTEFPYRIMVEAMNEGAVNLISDGSIFYCNPRFAEMVQVDAEKLIGRQFRELIPPDEHEIFETLFTQAGAGSRGEFCLQLPNDDCMSVQLSFYPLRMDGSTGVSIIATDITERIQAEEKIRTLAYQLTIAEQEERQRISQILHDDLQQRLFAIKTQLSLLTRQREKTGLPPAIHEDLQQIQGWLADAIVVTRGLSIDLSPNILKGEGLYEALQWLGSQMKDHHGLNVQLEPRGNLHALDPQIRLLLFQAVRELLFNIVKHAGTLQARVALEQVDNKVRVIVSDAGKGFDAGGVINDTEAAHGLLIIQDRLHLLGCTMEIHSEPGRGTRVIIEAPGAGS